MDVSNSATLLTQILIILVVALALGPWVTLAALRVIREPSYVEKSLLVNWVIQICAERHFLAPGNVRFWAWMAFLLGVIFDIMAIFALVAVVQIALFP
jgi:hypothetical protein